MFYLYVIQYPLVSFEESARRIYTSLSEPLTSDYEHTCHDIQRGRREDRCHDSTESPHIMPLGDRIKPSWRRNLTTCSKVAPVGIFAKGKHMYDKISTTTSWTSKKMELASSTSIDTWCTRLPPLRHSKVFARLAALSADRTARLSRSITTFPPRIVPLSIPLKTS